MTTMERFNVLLETRKGATAILNAILDEYGAVDLLNAFFPGLPHEEQQRFIDIVHRRIFAEEAQKVRVHDEYTYHGKKETLRELCIKARLPESTVVKRLCRGWSIEKALETPIRHANIQAGTCGF